MEVWILNNWGGLGWGAWGVGGVKKKKTVHGSEMSTPMATALKEVADGLSTSSIALGSITGCPAENAKK